MALSKRQFSTRARPTLYERITTEIPPHHPAAA
jgi:hypothetical protein